MKHYSKIEKFGFSEYVLNLRIKEFKSIKEIAAILKSKNIDISREAIRRFLNKNEVL